MTKKSTQETPGSTREIAEESGKRVAGFRPRQQPLAAVSAPAANPGVEREEAVDVHSRPLQKPDQDEEIELAVPHQGGSNAAVRHSRHDSNRSDLRPAEGIENEQFSEGDEATNASGDPRIGTHGRNDE